MSGESSALSQRNHRLLLRGRTNLAQRLIRDERSLWRVTVKLNRERCLGGSQVKGQEKGSLRQETAGCRPAEEGERAAGGAERD